MKKNVRMAGWVACVCAVCGLASAWGGADARGRVDQLVAQLADADAAKQAAAEAELRALGAAALPALRTATAKSESGQTRLRAIVVDLTVDNSRVNVEDARGLMALAREEALAKRYVPAARCYRRAERIFDTLKDEAKARKDRGAEKDLKDQRDVAERRADRAERIAKGEKFSGLNLGIVRVGVEHDNTDQDW